MSDNIDIPVTAGDPGPIERLAAAIERVEKAVVHLGESAPALARLEQAMKEMQAGIQTGLLAVQVAIEKSGQAQVASVVKTGEEMAAASERASKQRLTVEQRRDVEMRRIRDQELVSYVSWWDRMLDIQERRDTEMAAARAKSAANQLALEQAQQVKLAEIRAKQAQGRSDFQNESDARTWQNFLDIENRKAAAEEQRVARTRALTEAAQAESFKNFLDLEARKTASAEAAAARQRTLDEASAAASFKNFLDLEARKTASAEARAARQRALDEASAAASFQNFLDLEAKKTAAARRAQVEQEAAAERQRQLNAAFMVASPGSQLRTAREAQAYAGLGGDASGRFGSAAATADIAALERAHAALRPAVNNSRQAIENHSHAMNEAHSLARGLAGSLGGLWLTYGSVVPLVAGAAIAASLKQVVSVGADVEHQLTNVLALTNSGVNLDTFLQVSDGSLRSLVEGANAMRMLAQNGLNASQSLQVLPSILDLATVGEMTVGQAALAATGATSAFGLSMEQAGYVADVFAKTAATSNTSVLAITESMKQASTVASLYKVTLEETAGVLGILAKINITGGAAGTSMTNMLTGLYEPTAKGKKALEELGVSTQTATGAVKPFTQVMEELRGALARFNDSAKIDLLGSIFTVRGVKAVQQVQENLAEYKTKVREAASATGYMSEVVKRLEDDATGGFERLGVTMQNDFVKAFREASPYVQALALHLTDIAKSEGTQSTLKNFATNVARLTGAAIDNLGVITALGVAYIGLRALGPVIELVKAATAAQSAYTAATAAATVANAAHATAMSAGAATTATYTTMVEANTAATAAAAAATAAWEATLLPILGAVAIAVGAAAGLWLLFRDNTSEADRANQKLTNSLHVINDALDREIKQLKEANELWDARNGKYKDVGSVPDDKLKAARDQVAKIEADMRRRGVNPDDVRNAGVQLDAGTGQVSAAAGAYDQMAEALSVADSNLEKLLATQKRVTTELEPARALKNVHDATQQLRQDLEKFTKLGEEKNSKGEFYQKNEAVRALSDQSKKLSSALLDPAQRLGDTKAELERIEKLRTDLKELQDKRNSMLTPRDPATDRRAENDAYREAVLKVETVLQETQKQAQTTKRDIQSMYESGAISAVEAARKMRDVEVGLQQAAMDSANQKIALAGNRDYGKSDAQRALKDRAAAEAAIREANAQLDRADAETQKNLTKDRTQYEIDQARKAGDTVLAYRLENRVKLEQVDRGLADSRALLAQAIEKNDREGIASAMNLVLGFEQVKSQFDATITSLGDAKAFKDLDREFGLMLSKLNADFATFSNASQGSGLSAVLSDAIELQGRYTAQLPALITKQKELEAAAKKTGLAEDMEKALKHGRELETAGDRMQKAWINAGQVIEKALTNAFGNAGKAMGGLINATLQYGARLKDISAQQAADGNTPAAQAKAAQDAQSAQLSYYGNLASASANFFGTQSRGYQALMAVSRTFHAIELAQTLARQVPLAINAILSGGEAGGLPGMAAAAAAVAALGVSLGFGGGSDRTAEERQKRQGTGTVLGSADAKSESIARSLETIRKASLDNLDYSAGMLQALRSIENNISGLASIVVRNLGLDGTDKISGKSSGFNTQLGTAAGGALGALAGGALVGGSVLGGSFGILGAAAGPIGMALGAVLGGIVGKYLSSVKTELRDQGILLNATTLGQAAKGVTGSAYQDVNVKKSFLGLTYSNNTSRDSTALSSEVTQQFTAVISGIRSGIAAAATVLGAGGDDFVKKLDALAVAIPEISLKGMTGDQIQTALENVFGALGDKLAQEALPNLQNFQKVGEGYLETLSRIATDYQMVDAVMKSMGKTFGEVGLSSVAAREQLIDLAGGLDKFTEQGSYFTKNFLSKDEQLAPVKAELATRLQPYGSPQSIEEYKNLVLKYAGDTSQAGMQAYTTLLQLAPAFKTLMDAVTEAGQKAKDERKTLQDQLDELTLTSAQLLEKQRNALDESNRALFDQVQALKAQADAADKVKDQASALLGGADAAFSTLSAVISREKDVLQKRVDAETKLLNQYKELSSSLHSTLDSLEEANPTKYQYDAAKAQVQSALTIARAGGPLPKADDLKTPLATLAKLAPESYATQQDYLYELATTKDTLGQLADLSDDQVDKTQAQLDALDAQIKQYDEMLKNAQEQLNVLKGQSTTLLDIKEALALFQGSLTAAGGNPVVASGGALTAAYQQYLGRAPDSAGYNYYQDAIAKGGKIEDAVSSIANSPEATIRQYYKLLLNREPDAQGLAYYLNAASIPGNTLKQVRDSIASSDEYKKLHPFAVGTNFVPRTMPALVHEGERIIPAADNRMLMQMLSNPAGFDNSGFTLLSERIDRLYDMLQAHLYPLVRDTKNLYDHIDNAVTGDVPLATKAIT